MTGNVMSGYEIQVILISVDPEEVAVLEGIDVTIMAFLECLVIKSRSRVDGSVIRDVIGIILGFVICIGARFVNGNSLKCIGICF